MQRLTEGSPAAGLERRRARADRDVHARTRAITKDELQAFLGAEHPLRDKTLWWLLYDYETAARAGEVLGLDIENLACLA